MNRIIIVCEGPTEQEFCKDVLSPHFLGKDIHIQAPLIKKSGGGIVSWTILRRQLENHLLQDPKASVTTLIDYYGIKDLHKFPDWEKAKTITDKVKRMEVLEQGMVEDISSELRMKFKPNIQLHEFEGLLFSDINAFTSQIPAEDFVDLNLLAKTINDYPNPELINDTIANAPSYRLTRLIKGYNKIVYGAILAKEIGLPKIRNKCTRFNKWVSSLENL